MADAVTSQQLFPGAGKNSPSAVYHFTNISDGTGESGVKKVDITTLKNYYGLQPQGLRIERVQYSIQGFKDIVLAWDRTAGSETAMVLATGEGDLDLTGRQAGTVTAVTGALKLTGLVDPTETSAGDGKGSILLSTNATPTAGSTYDITLWLRLAPNQS